MQDGTNCSDGFVSKEVESMTRVCFVMPSYCDFINAMQLCSQIQQQSHIMKIEPSFVIVDDSPALDESVDKFLRNKTTHDISVSDLGLLNPGDYVLISLSRNVGHQRALNTGLLALLEAKTNSFDYVVTMDADGDDSVDGLQKLLMFLPSDSIIAAKRQKRKEGKRYRLLYSIFKTAFWILTRERYDIGNFVVMPWRFVGVVASQPHSAISIVGSILRSKLVIKRVPVDKGERFRDRSRMSTSNLFMHALTALSVFSDRVNSRIATAIGLLWIISLALIIVVFIAKMTIGAPVGIPSILIGLLLTSAFTCSLLLAIFAYLVVMHNQLVSMVRTPASLMLEMDILKIVKYRYIDTF